MNDAAFAFIEDVRDRKRTASGARHKKTGSKKCTLPSDYLTNTQKRRLNSMPNSYTMNQPHPWKEVKRWPIDLQREYLTKLNNMKASLVEMGKVLELNPTYVSQIWGKLGLPTRSSAHKFRTPEELKIWNDFLGITTKEPEPEPITTQEPEPIPQEPEPEPITTQEPEPKTTTPPTTCDSIELVFTGTMPDVLKALTLLPIGKKDRHRITIRVE